MNREVLHEPTAKPLHLTIIVAYGLALFSMLGLLARVAWPFELICHLRVPFCWMLLVVSAVAVIYGRRRSAAVFLVVGLFHLASIAPLYYGQARPAKAERDLRVMALNVLSSNREFGEVVKIVQRHRPDVLVLLESNGQWMEGVSALRDEYPYRRHQHDAPRNFGVSFYSRRPVKSCRFVELASTRVDAVVATLDVDGRELQIIGAHPVPPVSGRHAEARNRQLQELARLAAQHAGPTVLLGDLNVTSWSPYFQDLLRAGKLNDSRRGFGIQATHSSLPGVRLPIDHILISGDVRVHRRWVAHCRGSDHDAVLADLSLQPSP